MFNNLNGMCGVVGDGLCRLSTTGQIAIKTSTGGYKTYNVKTGILTDCSNFVFDVEGSNLKAFFVIPTNKVVKGDIILVNGKPKCVISVEKDKITVINYEDSTIEMIVPERHVFMDNTYFYGKIVSMFGNTSGKKNGAEKVMKYMIYSQMLNGKSNSGSNDMSSLLACMMFGGKNGLDDMFSGIFDMGDSDDEENEVDEEEE